MISLLLGKILKTNKNKPVFVRKRIFHAGYFICHISLGKTENEDLYILISKPNTYEELLEWLAKN